MEPSNQSGKVCGQCGAPLPADAPKGVCPHCELQGALGMLGAGSETTQSAEPSTNDSDHLPPRRFGNYELGDREAMLVEGNGYLLRMFNT